MQVIHTGSEMCLGIIGWTEAAWSVTADGRRYAV